MIISCSRRTDIPAFYSKWLFHRLREGYCNVRNPFNPNQISRVDLSPEAVTAIVFWTRYPEPMLNGIRLLDEMGYKYYFLITLNNYSKNYEENNPKTDKSIKSIYKLSELIGFEKVVWRYDPLIINKELNFEYHLKNFEGISHKLEGKVRKVITSIVSPYKKTLKRMREKHIEIDDSVRDLHGFRNFLSDLKAIANNSNLLLEICSDSMDFSDLGVQPARCIDDKLLNELFGLNIKYQKDKSQRKECTCTISKDIGTYNTCTMNCNYCYATNYHNSALNSYKSHNAQDLYL
jgi:hypothetical protein